MFLAAMMLSLAEPVPVEAKSEYIRLDPGKVMTVKEDGKFAITPAPRLTPGEEAKIAYVRTLGNEALGPNSVVSEVPPGSMAIVPGEVSFIMTQGENETALLIRNGLARSLRYKLLIQTERGLERTDVCEVFAPAHNTEHWPYKIEWMAIGELEQFDRKGQAAAVCK